MKKEKKNYKDFGALSDFGSHTFCLTLNENEVELNEDHGWFVEQEDVEISKRATLSTKIWKKIEFAVKNEFNERLKSRKMKRGSFKGKKSVFFDKVWGRELALLMYIVALCKSADEVQKVLKKWCSITPEERWWLYFQVEGDGLQVQNGKGWRNGLYVAWS